MKKNVFETGRKTLAAHETSGNHRRRGVLAAAVRENRMAGEARRGGEDVEETVVRDEGREAVLVFGRTRDDDDEEQRGHRRGER